MTRKDFVSLADHIKTAHESWAPAHLDTICAFCRSVNPRFNSALFQAYIRGESGPRGGKPNGKVRGHRLSSKRSTFETA